MDYQFIRVEREEPLTIVTINRPDVMNALSPPAGAEVSRAFAEECPPEWEGR